MSLSLSQTSADCRVDYGCSMRSLHCTALHCSGRLKTRRILDTFCFAPISAEALGEVNDLGNHGNNDGERSLE